MPVHLPNVDCSRGAPMGRRAYCDNPEALVCVQRVYLDSGGYDAGGAYWGLGQPLYVAQDDEGQFQQFRRAASKAQAVKLFRERFPNTRFI